MRKSKIVLLTILCSYLFSTIAYSNIIIPSDLKEENTNGSGENINDTEESSEIQYKTLDELLKELREKRKIIEQRRLEEIKLKKLQEELSKNENSLDEKVIDEEKIKKEEVKEVEVKIPKLIVRLRGKHSLKYLCEYDFTLKDEYGESKVTKCLVDDYSTLINNVSLKVRANEYINFEFDEKPKDLKVYYAKNGEELKLNRNSILVPDLEERVVLIIEGVYDNGFIKYAILLDIRRP